MEHQAPHQLRFLEELIQAFGEYYSAVIEGVFAGVVDSMGAKPLQKATDPRIKWLANIGNRFNKRIIGLVGRRTGDPKRTFVVRGRPIYKRNGQPYTLEEWQKFEAGLLEHLNSYGLNAAEEMAVKGILLAIATAEMDARGKTRKGEKETLRNVEKEYFKGYIPDTIESAKKRYVLGEEVEGAMKEGYMRAADYVQKVNDTVRTAIREQVQAGFREDKTARQLASDLYWNVQKDPYLRRDNLDQIERDWRRVARTEIAMIHERGKRALTEDQVERSMSNPDEAVYFVFHGSAKCPICKGFLGIMVRQIPEAMAGRSGSDSLEERGIKDQYTDIAVWQMKSNYGRTQKEFWVTTPVHPNCGCQLLRIYPDAQYYDVKNRTLKLKPEAGVPVGEEFLKELQTLEAENQLREDKIAADNMAGVHIRRSEYYTGHPVLAGYDSDGGRMADRDGTLYVEVPNAEINDRMDEWRNNRYGPIPVGIGTPDWKRIFDRLNG